MNLKTRRSLYRFRVANVVDALGVALYCAVETQPWLSAIGTSQMRRRTLRRASHIDTALSFSSQRLSRFRLNLVLKRLAHVRKH